MVHVDLSYFVKRFYDIGLNRNELSSTDKEFFNSLDLFQRNELLNSLNKGIDDRSNFLKRTANDCI